MNKETEILKILAQNHVDLTQDKELATCVALCSDSEKLKVLNEIFYLYRMYVTNEAPCVYFIKDLNTGYTKIGCSKQFKKRFKTIKAHNPNHLVVERIIVAPEERIHSLETEMHKTYAEQRVSNEWFNITEYVDEYYPNRENGIFEFDDTVPNYHLDENFLRALKRTDLIASMTYRSPEIFKDVCKETYIGELRKYCEHTKNGFRIVSNGQFVNYNFADIECDGTYIDYDVMMAYLYDIVEDYFDCNDII